MVDAPRKTFEFRAQWDAEAAVWWCTNDELPLTTEAPTLDQLGSRVAEAALEIAVLNGLARPGEEIRLQLRSVSSAAIERTVY
ncbi:MAG: DUF1902 domain-containing protein [Stellaceae bacterium]